MVANGTHRKKKKKKFAVEASGVEPHSGANKRLRDTMWEVLHQLPGVLESDIKRFQPLKDYMGLSDTIRQIQGRNSASEASDPTPPAREQQSDELCRAVLSGCMNLPPECDSEVPVAASTPRRTAGLWEPLYSRDALTAVDWKPAPSLTNGCGPINTPRFNPSRVPLSLERMVCRFCKHNGESDWVYKSHWLKNRAGDVVCPYLQKHVCPLCGATGTKAHTKLYCPKVDRAYRSVYTPPRR